MASKVSTKRSQHSNSEDCKTGRGDLSKLLDIFPDWTRDDLAAVLAEAGGDLERAIHRITEGSLGLFFRIQLSRACISMV